MSLAEKNLPSIKSSFCSITEGFFKPVAYNVIEQLIWQYKASHAKLHKLHKFIGSESMQSAVSYFLRAGSEQPHSSVFGDINKAVKILDSDYWEKALNVTDVYEFMPQKRRDEWNKSIESRDVPPFEEETVVNTLRDLLMSRDQFLSERVDGVFRSLSGEHVTNVPEGFSKRMILYVADKYATWTSVNSSKAGYLHDLRVIIAKFMKRAVPMYGSTYDIVNRLYKNKNTGKWQDIDGGALRLKVFTKGTAHLEVHPDIAWRLNEILALLHPRAIPSQFRKRPEKKLKAFSFTQNLIPGDVLNVMLHVEPAYIWRGEGRNRQIEGRSEDVFYISGSYGKDKHLIAKAFDILEACGGQRIKGDRFKFDYDFNPILHHILSVGAIPDHVAHQYYPTPATLAKRLVLWCEIREGDRCLEPSAGQGGIVQFMPKSTICVEASPLHCKILEQKGYQTVQGDFLEWSKGVNLFSRICLNPPYSQGRAEAHLHAAANLLEKDGILTAIVPASLQNKEPLKGFKYEWEDIDQTDFPGVSISLVMVKMIRKQFV